MCVTQSGRVKYLSFLSAFSSLYDLHRKVGRWGGGEQKTDLRVDMAVVFDAVPEAVFPVRAIENLRGRRSKCDCICTADC
jgi:hypothetical protein